MRTQILTLMSLVLASTEAFGGIDEAAPPPPMDYVVTYYDRNGDGKVDFELHHLPGGADADWALSDTKFRGRYDVRIYWSFTLVRESVDLPVPAKVKITPGKPPVSETK